MLLGPEVLVHRTYTEHSNYTAPPFLAGVMEMWVRELCAVLLRVLGLRGRCLRRRVCVPVCVSTDLTDVAMGLFFYILII